jgi:hypothetical protein
VADEAASEEHLVAVRGLRSSAAASRWGHAIKRCIRILKDNHLPELDVTPELAAVRGLGANPAGRGLSSVEKLVLDLIVLRGARLEVLLACAVAEKPGNYA